MATGTVKWFNNAKGFGFICPEGEDGDILLACFGNLQSTKIETRPIGRVLFWCLN